MKLGKLKIGVKFAVTFLLLIGLFMLIASTAFINLRTVTKASAWNTHTFEVLGHSSKLYAAVVGQQAAVRGYLISADEAFLAPFAAGKAEFQAEFKTLVDLTADDPAQQERLMEIGKLESDWRSQAAEPAIALMTDPATRQQARSLEASGAGKGVMDALHTVHREFEIAENALIVSSTETKNNAAAFAKSVIVFGSAIVLAIAVALAYVLTRHVGGAVASLTQVMGRLAAGENDIDVPFGTRGDEIGEMARSVLVFRDAAIDKERMEREASENRNLSDRERADREAAKAEEAESLNSAIERLGEGLQQLSGGNLTTRLDTPFDGDLDRLRTDFNASVEKLAKTLSDVKQNTHTIHSNAGEMRSAVEDLSRRTEQQAASLEETSASLEEITATVKSSSDRAQEASTKAAEANAAGEASARVVADAVGAMSRIESASGEIAKIIGVIDEIAFQTNLLALNAGVEAARAGEAGKGFAVVAQEVRELAQRSAVAAKEIKALIGKSSDEVANGVDLVKATGEALSKIAGHVVDINAHIESIATAAREQATGLQEVNTAVSQMDQVTQQNAAMVEQTTAVTHRLASEADGLNDMLSYFVTSTPVAAAVRTGDPVAVDAGRGGAYRGDQPASPAKSMIGRVHKAFAGNGAAAAEQEWSEF